jgi:hypothetical protein
MPTTYNGGVADNQGLFTTLGNPDNNFQNSANEYGPSAVSDFGNTVDFYDKAFTWEPKYQHKFVLKTQDLIPAFLIKTAAKPSMTNGEVVLDHINVKRKLKGKSAWNSIAITIYDAIVPSAAQAVMEWVRLHHESATGRDGYSSLYKKDLILHSLSPLGEVIEEWQIKGAYLQEVNFGSLDWSSEDVVMIDATLNYDWALLSF